MGPALDFSRVMVLAAFSGRRPGAGYSVRIERVVQSAGELVVEVVESSPAPGCLVAETPFFPRHLLAVPRFEGTVRFVVRQSVRGSCLQPPELRLSCRVDSPEAWRTLGPVLHAKPGQQVLCEASSEPGASLGWSLLAAPASSRARLEALGSGARLAVDAQGSYLLGVEARGIDGQSCLERVRLDTEVPRYEIALTEEEPEGARGLDLVLIKQQEGTGTSRCSGEASPSWCGSSRDGFQTRLSVAAEEAGRFAVRVVAAPGSLPSPRLSVRLGERSLVSVAVPDDPSKWGADGWPAGVLFPRDARFEADPAPEQRPGPR